MRLEAKKQSKEAKQRGLLPNKRNHFTERKEEIRYFYALQ